jgi:hypothetical protein
MSFALNKLFALGTRKSLKTCADNKTNHCKLALATSLIEYLSHFSPTLIFCSARPSFDFRRPASMQIVVREADENCFYRSYDMRPCELVIGQYPNRPSPCSIEAAAAYAPERSTSCPTMIFEAFRDRMLPHGLVVQVSL